MNVFDIHLQFFLLELLQWDFHGLDSSLEESCAINHKKSTPGPAFFAVLESTKQAKAGSIHKRKIVD